MKHRTFMSHEERAARSALAKLLHERPILCGSVVTMARTCGNKGCRCARGERHRSLYLSIRAGERRKMIYVPTEMEGSVRGAVQAYREAAGLIETVSQACLARLVAQKEQAAEDKARRRRREGKGSPE